MRRILYAEPGEAFASRRVGGALLRETSPVLLRKAFSLGRRWPESIDSGRMWGVSNFRAVRISYPVPSTPGPFGATLCKQERASLRRTKIYEKGRLSPPLLGLLNYISGSRPRTGWPFSVSQFSSSSQSVVTVSSAI